MRHTLCKKLLSSALLAVMLCALPALAARDIYGLGMGTTDLKVDKPDTIINHYAQVTEQLQSGSTTIKVDSIEGFAKDMLVMVHQSVSPNPSFPSGPGPFSFPTNDSVARWELARLKEVSRGMLTLDHPLVTDYAANVTQVILVPEYKSVTVTSSGLLTGQAWDGRTGGVLAFLAKEKVHVDGEISMDNKGFRGGKYVQDPANPLNKECPDNAEAPRGAQKGEGIANTVAMLTGRSNVANAGGGGVCLRSGGAGGGHCGAGGRGGNTDSIDDRARPMGGDGGAALLYDDRDLLTRLTFGGGGGAGHSTASLAPNLGGGAGGGIIFIRSTMLTGSGVITAKGGRGLGDELTLSAGGNGGGSGGSIYLRFASLVQCYVEVQGGAGSTTRASAGRYLGPGGGGGGGFALLQSTNGNNACTLDVEGASSGQRTPSPSNEDNAYGAKKGDKGTLKVIATGFPTTPLPEPVVTTPADSSRIRDTTPRYAGTISVSPALPTGTVVFVYVDGREVGSTEIEASGNWNFEPSTPVLLPGNHTVYAVAVNVPEAVGSKPSNTNTFFLDTTAPTVVVQTPAEGSRTNDTTPEYTGTVSDDGPGPLTVMVSVDNGAPVPATVTGSTWSYTPTTPLAPGPHTVTATATDGVGNTASDSNAFTVDNTAPTVEVKKPAEGSRTTDTTPEYTGMVSDDGPGPLTVMVSVDDGSPVPATVTGSTWNYTPTTPLAPGLHKVTATATDRAGNTASDSNAFTVEVDTTLPDTIIVSGPEGNTHSPDATFDFSSDETDVTYECSLDGGTFTACTDPDTFENLAEGEHTLQVRARDNAGNVDPTPASRTWNYHRPTPERDFLGDGIGCAASGGSPSALAMMGLVALSMLLAHRRQR